MAKRYDLHIQVLPEAIQRDTFKFMSFGYDEAIGIVGFQMLINQWLKCFLTPRGSDATNLDYGTEFGNLIGSNLDYEEARDVCIISIDQTNDTIRDNQRLDSNLTPSERLGDAVMTGFVELPSAPGFEVYVEITNQANERLVLNLPVGGDA